MIKLPDAGIFLILALIAGFGCDRSPANRAELPAIPPVDTSGLEPAVREQLSAARRAVDADPGSPAANGALSIFASGKLLSNDRFRRAGG